MDLVRKNGDKVDIAKLSSELNCEVVEISALKGEGIQEAANRAIAAANGKKSAEVPAVFEGSVEKAISLIEDILKGKVSDNLLRWYAVKIFERDAKVLEEVKLSSS